jgi:single-strand DNA-binding protein
MNKVFLMGNLGKDPELSHHNGAAKLSFTLATTDKWKDKATGEPRERTDWHNVVIWGIRAERLVTMIHKGDRVVVQGRIQTDQYEKDGQKKYYTSVKADDIHLAGGNHRRSEGSSFDFVPRDAQAGRKTLSSDQIPF